MWSYIENIDIIVCATVLAYAWDSAWPFLLLLFINYRSAR